MGKRNEASLLVLLSMAVVVFLSVQVQVKSAVAASSYMDSPEMQKAVRDIVEAASPDLLPGLIRLLFHDCFVNGCDGSVLLNTSRMAGSDGKTEMTSGFNVGLRGLDVIQKIKATLWPTYGITCTDAVIYGAREAVYLLSNKQIAYDVDGPGRKDGVISRSEDPARFLPTPSFTFEQLKESFRNQSLEPEDVIVLSGAHAVGVAHRTFFDINTVGTPLSYQIAVARELSNGAGVVKNNVRDFNPPLSDYKDDNEQRKAAKGVLDNSFYNTISQNMALFPSDRVLWKDAETNVIGYKNNVGTWYTDFAISMAKLGRLPAPWGAPWEYRKVCNATN
ncbi:Peroxidase 47 [Hordeum vulgare]|nr:Peroxidase 47 [Hordeum vulgare]